MNELKKNMNHFLFYCRKLETYKQHAKKIPEGIKYVCNGNKTATYGNAYMVRFSKEGAESSYYVFCISDSGASYNPISREEFKRIVGGLK
jgi:hypothetical protein